MAVVILTEGGLEVVEMLLFDHALSTVDCR